MSDSFYSELEYSLWLKSRINITDEELIATNNQPSISLYRSLVAEKIMEFQSESIADALKRHLEEGGLSNILKSLITVVKEKAGPEDDFAQVLIANLERTLTDYGARHGEDKRSGRLTKWIQDITKQGIQDGFIDKDFLKTGEEFFENI